MESKSSIHICPVKSNSESHNLRKSIPDYVNQDLMKNNIYWTGETISNVTKRVKELYLKTVGQKMQEKSTPIREGVVNLKDVHPDRMNDLKKLALEIEKRFNIKTFQIHIHGDEGHFKKDGTYKNNFHAHMLFNWTDDKGKSIKLNRSDMAEFQTITATILEMERGVPSDKKHLNALQFKILKRQEELESIIEVIDKTDIRADFVVEKQRPWPLSPTIDYEATFRNMNKLILKYKNELKKLHNELNESKGKTELENFKLNEAIKKIQDSVGKYKSLEKKLDDPEFLKQRLEEINRKNERGNDKSMER